AVYNGKNANLDASFLPFIFFLILAYFYYLFTEWLIKKFTTYQIDQKQFFQVLQEKKLVVEGQEYQVEKIDNLKVRFHSQMVNFHGTLIIPQEGSDLKLDFFANAPLDYYKQQLFNYLQGMSWQVQKKKQLSWMRICFHLTLLTFFFGYLFTITPKIIQVAQNRHQEQTKPGGRPSSGNGANGNEESEGGTGWGERGKIARFLHRLDNEPFPPQAKKAIKEKIRELQATRLVHERVSLEEWLEKIMTLPWWQTTPENQDLTLAKKELDQEHFGLEKVKERVLTYLAGKQRAGKKQTQVLCLVGPPGTGKTSLAQSIAKATGRKFAKISVGGVSDESQIRGHSRTYIASMPGKIIQGMKEAEVINPVFLIDEIDKVNTFSSWHGNPSSALLEVLDPEQNKKFADSYVEIPYDLSQVFFVCTANWIQDIPAPLLDRMDVIQLPPYTTLDKVQIAKNQLIPRTLAKYNLSKDQLTFTDEAIEEIIKFYVQTGGMRTTASIFERIAAEFAKKQIMNNLKSEIIDLAKVYQYLGPRATSKEDLTDYSQSGVVNGLAWTEAGGVILPVEASCLPAEGKSGKLIEASGNLGKIMNESAKVAYRYVRVNYQTLGISEAAIKENDVFLHFPEGAIPKDGPSAGITITTAIISALKGEVIPRNYSMTGEISFKGKVLAIGGLREKLTAAYEDKFINTVFIPRENTKHLSEVPTQVKEKLTIIPVDNYLQVWEKIKGNISSDYQSLNA
ncbi:MAG: ATP-dependent protease La, partial [Mycoplasmataceae bacterium CE_OT135]